MISAKMVYSNQFSEIPLRLVHLVHHFFSLNEAPIELDRLIHLRNKSVKLLTAFLVTDIVKEDEEWERH